MTYGVGDIFILKQNYNLPTRFDFRIGISEGQLEFSHQVSDHHRS